MILKLGLDILWTDIFPLLDLRDLYNLYLSHPYLKGAIAEYKDWDLEYTKLFDCDYAEGSSSGINKVFKRLNAVAYLWGVYTVGAMTKTDSPGNESTEFFKESYSPVPTKCSVGAIRQYLSERSVLLCNGKVMQWSRMYQPGQRGLVFEKAYPLAKALSDFSDSESDYEQEYGSIATKAPGAWVPESGWPDFVQRIYPNNYEAHSIDGNRLFHQQPTAPAAGIEFSERVLAASFAYSKIDVLLENQGLVTGMEFSHPDAYAQVVEQRDLPEPIKNFCSISGLAYALLSFTGKVYIAVKGTAEAQPALFPCAIKEITSFGLRYSMEPIVDRCRKLVGWTCWSSTHAQNYVGFLALGVNGRIYHYKADTGVLDGHIPNLENIVKMVSRGTAMLALDNEGQVFYMGSIDAINPGLGDKISTDIIINAPQLPLWKDIETQPDLTSAWLHPECVDTSRPADLRKQRPYIVVPRQVPLPGRVVDINVYGKQVSALVLSDP